MTKSSYAAVALAAVTFLACAVEKKPPVSESAKSVAQAYVDAWNRHDSVAVDSLLAPDGLHEDLSQNVHAKGRAQVADFLRKTLRVEPDFKWQVTNVIEEGRYVALEWTWNASYTGPDPSGKQVTNRRVSGRGASFAEVENRKIKRFSDYFDAASFFR
jgi:steroid delta-isomerase-like uncharacterized protein